LYKELTINLLREDFKINYSLSTRLRAQIEVRGPLPLADFMAQALYDPHAGYYQQKAPIGRQGDYITAPEMTQVFGEIIALWLIDIWHQAGCPTPFHLIELGPGRGTLMADILRTFQSLKMPCSAMTIHLVEVSRPLKDLQKAALAPFSMTCQWHDDLTSIPSGFSLWVGNEFWDALPLCQIVQTGIERCVDWDGHQFIFIPEESASIWEHCPAMPGLVSQIAPFLHNGAALFIDYGYDQEGATGDTLQALLHHRPHHPLANPGQVDLTHHVDFHRLKSLFQEAGLAVYGPTFQGQFLTQMGLESRTEQLCARATPDQRGNLRTAAVRLTNSAYMGALFKVISVMKDESSKPVGFS
jgi:NADH dehydrogenase [ubiquinone] 1 alpha subcomplex assembly factor 7